MSQQHNMSEWWNNLATEDQLQFVGRWAEKFPGEFDTAWADFEEDVLIPTAYYPKNAWTMDAERQDIFIDYLLSNVYKFTSWLESALLQLQLCPWSF